MIKFYDTSSLLTLQDKAFEEYFITSSIVIKELENIKTGVKKSEDIRYAARKLTRLFDSTKNYKIVIHNSEHDYIVDEKMLPPTNDNLILACAYEVSQDEEIEFCSDDIILRLTGENYFGLNVSRPEKDGKGDAYLGYKNVYLNDDKMAHFYSNTNINTYNCLINEYLIIHNENGEQVDVCKWNGSEYDHVYDRSIKSTMFGDRLKSKDVYQRIALDSIMANTITVITGRAGSGKSLLSLASAVSLVESGKYSRIIVLFNPTSVRGASRLGFYSGDMIEKAMQTSIGNILVSKFGNRYNVDTLMQQDELRLVSMADARGFEVHDDEILFITEAQNTDIALLKLCLSRASQNAKIIIEGDISNQVDSSMFDGNSNGVRRAIEVLKGEDIFGYVELKNVWRSRIAELAERM